MKTGAGTYPEHALQDLSYLRADFVASTHTDGRPDGVDTDATFLLKEAKGIGILHLTPEGYGFHNLAITPKLEQAYKAQCVLARWYATTKSIQQLEVLGA